MNAAQKVVYNQNWWRKLRADPVKTARYKKRQQERSKKDWEATKADPEKHAARLKKKRESATYRRQKDPTAKDRQRESSAKWRRSRKGFVKDAHRMQREASRRKGYLPPSYSYEELEQWVAACPKFDQLFEAWKVSGYSERLKPSFDRINPLLPYSLDNLQMLTWRENYMKGVREKHLLYTYVVRNASAKFKAKFGDYLKNLG